jgi:uncharacterized protein YndB with AHSA1/START domain
MTATRERSSEADREIVVVRTIQGPRDLVFEAYTDVSHLSQWWGPDGFTTTTLSFDFRPGGVWDFVMHGPDGTDYPNWIEWLEIVPPERIVLVHGERAHDPRAFVTTFTLIERDGATEVTLRAVFLTKEQRDEVVAPHPPPAGGPPAPPRPAAHGVTHTKAQPRG